MKTGLKRYLPKDRVHSNVSVNLKKKNHVPSQNKNMFFDFSVCIQHSFAVIMTLSYIATMALSTIFIDETITFTNKKHMDIVKRFQRTSLATMLRGASSRGSNAGTGL